MLSKLIEARESIARQRIENDILRIKIDMRKLQIRMIQDPDNWFYEDRYNLLNKKLREQREFLKELNNAK